MKLHEALAQSKHGSAIKATEDGTHTVDKANISAGYYADFKPADPARRSPVSTSFYWESDKLKSITGYAGEDGWQPGR